MPRIDKSPIKAAIAAVLSDARQSRAHIAELLLAARSQNEQEAQRLRWAAACAREASTQGSEDRRALTLAAAFMNNTRYSQCESADTRRAPPLKQIEALVRQCIDPAIALSSDDIGCWCNRELNLTRHDLIPYTAGRRATELERPERMAA